MLADCMGPRLLGLLPQQSGFSNPFTPGSSDSDPSVPLVLGVNSDRGPMKWMKVQALISVLLLGVAAKPKKQIPEPQTPAPEQPTADHVKFQDLVAGPLKTASDLVDDQVSAKIEGVLLVLLCQVSRFGEKGGAQNDTRWTPFCSAWRMWSATEMRATRKC